MNATAFDQLREELRERHKLELEALEMLAGRLSTREGKPPAPPAEKRKAKSEKRRKYTRREKPVRLVRRPRKPRSGPDVEAPVAPEPKRREKREFELPSMADRKGRKFQTGGSFADLVREVIQGMDSKPFNVPALRAEFEVKHPGELAKRSSGTLAVTLLSLTSQGLLTRSKVEGSETIYQKVSRENAPTPRGAVAKNYQEFRKGIEVPRDPLDALEPS